RLIFALIVSRFSESQRSCSSCVSSKRSNTSSTVREPVTCSCFRILASKAASWISMFILSLHAQCRLLNRSREIANVKATPPGVGLHFPVWKGRFHLSLGPPQLHQKWALTGFGHRSSIWASLGIARSASQARGILHEGIACACLG